MKNKQSGQTLLEALIALATAVVIISAMTVLVLSSLNNAQFSKNQNQATQYAQQGIEFLKNLSETDWAGFAANTNVDYCLSPLSKLPEDPKQAKAPPYLVVKDFLKEIFGSIAVPQPAFATTLVTFPIATGADDVSCSGPSPCSSFTMTTNFVPVGQTGAGTYYHGAFRFTGVTVPKDSTIATAYVQFRAYDSRSSATVKTKIRAEATDNATQITSATDFNNRIRTSAQADFDPSNWTAGSWYASLELASVIQEVVNRAGWSSGNAINIFWEDNGSSVIAYRFASTDDQNPSYGAELVITYTPPETPTPIPTPTPTLPPPPTGGQLIQRPALPDGCGPNLGIFSREVTINQYAALDPNTDCLPISVDRAKVTVSVGWSDNKCTNPADPYCHKIKLISCTYKSPTIPVP